MKSYKTEAEAVADGCRWCVDTRHVIIGTADEAEMRKWLWDRSYRTDAEIVEQLHEYEVRGGPDEKAYHRLAESDDIVAPREVYERLGGSVHKGNRVAFHADVERKIIFVADIGKDPNGWIEWCGFNFYIDMEREWKRIKKAAEEGGAE